MMDTKYLEEIKARLADADIADDWDEVDSGLVYQDIPALLAEVERLNEFCNEWYRGEDQFQETVSELDCANSALDDKNKQIATLEKALEIASEQANTLFNKLELFGIISPKTKASCIQDNVDTWIQQAQEQETNK